MASLNQLNSFSVFQEFSVLSIFNWLSYKNESNVFIVNLK